MKIKFPKWFYQLASPRWFYDITSKLLPWFAIAALLLMVIGSVWGLAFAPADYQQGNSFRIIYIHVPTAILAQSCYMLMAIAGGIGLIWKIKVAHVIAKSCAPIGASMAVLALVTGAIWGKPTWGAWWVWDARLTSMLVLFFLYIGVIALTSAFEHIASGDKAAAVLALVGIVNIPIIKYSVEWWNTLHQGATFKVTEKPAMPSEMWIPLLIMIIGFYCFFAVLLMSRARTEVLRRESKTDWVKLLVERY
ncbi:MAG: heme ABC transporter permease [Methylococcales bacterium]|nr:heme ABC transporter permease [Methylococcales bacterium]